MTTQKAMYRATPRRVRIFRSAAVPREMFRLKGASRFASKMMRAAGSPEALRRAKTLMSSTLLEVPPNTPRAASRDSSAVTRAARMKYGFTRENRMANTAVATRKMKVRRFDVMYAFCFA